ncbi:ATP-dependent nuclease [Burkholderia gladioli]|uniref:ATP-dependent nuclease n=1 Tax=Burkholderia gladioli TaxID=28095 RepID=UPI0016409118|nr:AAA family ATPase [Burkholderia gladioli]
MRISRVVIQNFRAFQHLDISLDNNISCVIGENNTGKSAFLHAIRLCIDANLSSTYRSLSMRDISTAIDIRRPAEVLIGLEITDYAGKVNEEALVGAWSVEPNRARLIYRFRPRPTIRERLAVEDPTLGELVLSDYQWELQGGGDAKIDLADIEWNEDVGSGIRFSDLQAFQVVFLPALRDVESDLRQPRSSPFVKLIEASTITDAEKHKLVTVLEEANSKISSSDTITKLARAVDKSFNEVAGPAFEMTIDVGLAEPTFQSVVRALRLLLSNDAVTDADPSSNGLGVNNVLYISILIEYFKRRLQQENSAGQLILFEEPEAHLHPQLQLSLYAALEGLPFQTILTTHSTHITAQAGLNKFVTLTNVGTGYSHSSVPSACDDLSDDDVADLERYLDATKSGLLFARKVMLVEGPAELLLIPALVKQVLRRDLDREGITVVPIYGVHFDVYAKLFSKHGLPKKCAIIADGDLTPSDAAESGLSDEEAPFNAPDLARLESKYVRVFANSTTFERAVTMSGNLEMFARTASSLGAITVAGQLRRWQQEWKALDPGSEGAKALVEKCRVKVLSTAKRYGKARFAQVAARNISSATSIPPYIRNAIEWLSEA